jgi:hypothetical protein
MRKSWTIAAVLAAILAIGAFALMRILLPDLSSVSGAFDRPPSYPGYQWKRDGRPVSAGELGASAGPTHCDWQSATILTIGWPLGTDSSNIAQARVYIRDPRGVMGSSYKNGLVTHAHLPADARPTGYRLGSIDLYLSPSDQDQAAYLVAPSGAERWPRADPFMGCA